MNWPQWTLVVLMLIGLGSSMAKYGQPKTDKYDIADVLIGPAIVFFLLWAGNFFEAGSKF